MAFSNIRFDDQVVQAVRDAVDIVEIAGEMTRLKRAGKGYQGRCPFHKEKTPSFSVDPTKGLYYCFGCGAGGDAIKLFQEQTGDDFPAAIEALARRYAIPLPEPSAPRDGRQRPDLRTVLEAAEKFFKDQLARSDFARGYLDQRRIPAELRASYGLGYAPDGWRHLLQSVGQRFPQRDLLAAGLVAKSERTGELYDRFRHRLMFPIQGPSGRLVGFGGRALGDDKAKYVNTSETDQFHKGNLLYGFHLAKREIRDGSRALLVEGYFDVIGTAASGIGWAVAGMGTALTADQARLLARYCDEVIIAYDGDEAGEKAHRRALPLLLAAGVSVRRALFPPGHDPDSLRLADGPEAVAAVVESAVDAIEAEIERLAPPAAELDPRASARAANRIAELLRPVRDRVILHTYGRRAAERLGIPLDMLWRRAGGRRDRTAEPAVSVPAPASSDEGSLGTEERAVALLCHSEAAVPPAAELPPEEVFFDADCRSIYAAFRALYGSAEQKVPSGNDVVAQLSREGVALDRIARLLLEEPDASGTSLSENLDLLVRRWQKQRGPV
ncbi:MAG: DNA primase, partial [Thermoanaerobaculia bacterium]